MAWIIYQGRCVSEHATFKDEFVYAVTSTLCRWWELVSIMVKTNFDS